MQSTGSGKGSSPSGQLELNAGLSALRPGRVSRNVRLSEELKEPAFKPREFLANKDARSPAEDLLAMEQADFTAAFRKSPMKRAKLAGLQRNARVVLGD